VMSQSGSGRKRPGTVTLLAALNVVGGIVFLALAIYALSTGYTAQALVFTAETAAVMAAGYGLLKGRPWAWWLEVIILSLSLLDAAASLAWRSYMAATTPGIEGHVYGSTIPSLALKLIFSAVFLNYLLSPEARTYFGVEWPPRILKPSSPGE